VWVLRPADRDRGVVHVPVDRLPLPLRMHDGRRLQMRVQRQRLQVRLCSGVIVCRSAIGAGHARIRSAEHIFREAW
jgi:hypothetical protein